MASSMDASNTNASPGDAAANPALSTTAPSTTAPSTTGPPNAGRPSTLAEFLGSALLAFESQADGALLSRDLIAFLNHIPCGVFWKDTGARFQGGNAALLSSLGLTSIRQLIGRTDHDFHNQADAELYRADDLHVMETDTPIIDRLEPQSFYTGQATYVSTTKLPLHDETGRVIGLIGLFVEIDNPTGTQQAIDVFETRLEERLDETQVHPDDGAWEFDVTTNLIRLSGRAAGLSGLGEEEVELPWPEVARLVDPQFRLLLEDSLRAQPTIPNAPMIAAEVPMTGDDGVLRWFKVIGAGVAEGGRILRIRGTVTDITADRNRRNELLRLATVDWMTGLGTRAALMDRLGSLLPNTASGLVLLDLDDFKVVNDSLGHEWGNLLLQAVATRLQELRPDPGVRVLAIVRFSGDEFGMLLTNADLDATVRFAENAVAALAEPFVVDDLEVYTSASCGVVHYPLAPDNAEHVLRDADTALSAAKAAGKNRSVLFHQAMRDQAVAELERHNLIRGAAKSMDFVLHYQPIFTADTTTMIGAEALIRWTPDAERTLYPDQFLPYLESSGLIVPVGAWVLDEACRQFAEWRDAGQTVSFISVNLSRVQFRDRALVETVRATLSRHGVAPEDLHLEVTETAVTSETDDVPAQLAQLQDMGVTVSMDDFGVGQSALSVLYELPLDVIKIDRAFIARITADSVEPVTAAVLNIAHSLGLKVIAEGVETPDQLAWLQRRDCHLIQGYLLGRPVPGADIQFS